MTALDDSTQAFARQTLNETPEALAEALAALRLWISSNPHLHVNPEERSLVAFLRACKFDLGRTKAKLADYYTMRRDIPEWYSNRDPSLPQIQALAKLGVFVPLRRHHENQLVVIIRTAAHDPRVHCQDDVFKAGNMILDVATRDDHLCQIFGIVAIFDMEGVGFWHGRQMTPGIIKKAVRSWQNYHCRPKKLEFVNAPIYINVILSIFKGFMSEKLKGRVKVHYGGREDVLKIVPKEVLPKEYGGEDGSLEEVIGYWVGRLEEEKEWFAQDEKFKAE
ncbi:retinol-binding protein pinta [Tribolium madens]|uniref:retinol-binding protein pinta n=1 Tax=Tribolium madens TaxID=41895 RepID=UPI001CF76041|nr:retinol-binding protein pinta [Tribolium madens]